MKVFSLRLILILTAAVLLVNPLNGSEVFPGDGFAAGWKSSGQIREFNHNGLYGHINGGSELFLELGFDVLHVQKYRHHSEAHEVSLETYKMESPEAALGIYLMKCGSETPVSGIDKKVRHTGDRHQITLLKGNYFVTVNNFSGKSSLIGVMVGLANQVLAKIPAAEPADLFSLLPKENRVPGSEMLVRGPFSLEAIYTLGQGDVLLLKNKIFGVTAQYEYKKAGTPPPANPDTYNQLVVRYPDEISSQKAFAHLKANLDSYIRVLAEDKNHLAFKDYRGKLGQVFLKGDMIRIRFNLPEVRP